MLRRRVFYAALLLAVGVYLYFEFLDGGSFFNSYMAYLDSPEVKRLFETGGMEQLAGGISLKDMKNIAEAFQDLVHSPRGIAPFDYRHFLAVIGASADIGFNLSF